MCTANDGLLTAPTPHPCGISVILPLRSLKIKWNRKSGIIPPFVNYEIKRGLMIKPVPAHEKAYVIICANCSLEEMTFNVWLCAARIYAELYTKRFTVIDADILIAAFCMENGYTLVTANIKDFENIDGLQIVNWVE